MSSLVVQTSFIGDVILTTPLLARLAEEGDVDVVTSPAGATLLRSHPAVRNVIVYDKRGEHRGTVGFFKTARGLTRPDRAYLCQGSVRSAALAIAAGARERAGFNTSAGSWLYSRRVEYRDDWHHARRLLSLGDLSLAASAENRTDSTIRPRLYPTPEDIARVDAILKHVNRPIIALAPGSVWRTKRWPYYAELAEMLAEDHTVALIGGDADMGVAEEIASRIPREHALDVAGKLSLLGSAELLRRSLALVTNDSSPQHLASAVGTPTVSIFGPTVPSFGFGPLAPGSVTVGRDGLACRPCDRHGPNQCPLGHWHCMREISAGEVDNMVRSVIAMERAV